MNDTSLDSSSPTELLAKAESVFSPSGNVAVIDSL